MKKKAYITPKLVIVDVELENELLLATSTIENDVDPQGPGIEYGDDEDQFS